MSFEEHCKSEHNMWHYLYFIVLIKVKDPTEFTGPESYVYTMVKVSAKVMSMTQYKPDNTFLLYLSCERDYFYPLVGDKLNTKKLLLVLECLKDCVVDLAVGPA